VKYHPPTNDKSEGGPYGPHHALMTPIQFARNLFVVPALAACVLAASAGAATQEATYRQEVPDSLVSFEMVLVPGGEVTIDGKTETVAPFYLGRTEVTWDLYDVFAIGDGAAARDRADDATARPSNPYGAPDYGWGHKGYAAISIARPAADAFAKWLSETTGRRYRVPTETEWVHAATLAARELPDTADRWDGVAWHLGNSGRTTHPVATKAPDALGLFDLFGNAAEWVATASGDFVVRGGSFLDPPERLGPAARAVQDDMWNDRDPQLPKSQWWLSDGPFVGFRLASDVTPAP
jgi:formylglycine-generating enzyme required for sulfatase activity